VDEVDRPEYVGVAADDDGRDDRAEDSRVSRCTQRQRLERHPHSHKPIGADNGCTGLGGE